ncbi:IclR family transcriptional regulator [Arthrobacter sp. AZCC_0090]|uniref:IclR family transcriptional regulator n=1 Tax=Arthrobacter sp. AZCC_0090 TaxID=2735881 RepID=UPI0017EC2F5D|nr:IclR family transcriptional regulator [Arthrobacter sp. AZCC_0090]MBB6407016.1 DNA-binding IclR family transcriptional regulator [Arthrobacter sp. AZCC_0090]
MATHTSFERGLMILAEIADSGDATVEGVALKLGIPVSTTYRYFRQLRERGFVQEDAGIYRPGHALLALTGRHLTQSHLAEVGTAVLKSIVDAVGETAVMVIRVGTQAMCLRRAEPDKAFKYTFAVNELLPLTAGAGPRTLLAWAPSDVVRQVLDGDLPRFTENSPSAEQILLSLAQIRSSGWAVSRGELDPGAVSVAVPVMLDGEAVCALNVAGPENRCGSRAWLNSTLKTMNEAAENLAASLGSLASRRTTREVSDDAQNSA